MVILVIRILPIYLVAFQMSLLRRLLNLIQLLAKRIKYLTEVPFIIIFFIAFNSLIVLLSRTSSLSAFSCTLIPPFCILLIFCGNVLVCTSRIRCFIYDQYVILDFIRWRKNITRIDWRNLIKNPIQALPRTRLATLVG